MLARPTPSSATGLADVGGMIVALHVLARDEPPASMRASLVLFLRFCPRLLIGLALAGLARLAPGA